METWEEIHSLEVGERYPDAIEALEARLAADPSDSEAVTRLGFNYWYVVVEAERMGVGNTLPVEAYAVRFMGLLDKYRSQLGTDPDFCFAFGLGISLFWHFFPGASQEVGDELLRQAVALDPFYERQQSGHATLAELAERFSGRGVLSAYFDIDE